MLKQKGELCSSSSKAAKASLWYSYEWLLTSVVGCNGGFLTRSRWLVIHVGVGRHEIGGNEQSAYDFCFCT